MNDEPRTLPALLHRSLEAYASNTALITMDERFSYAELSERVDAMAAALVGLGVGKGSRIGLLMENTPDWIALAFAATGLGAVLVPVSTFSKQDDVAYQVRHADVGLLFLSDHFLKNDYLSMVLESAPELDGAVPGRLMSAGMPALRTVVVKGDVKLPSGCLDWNTFEAAGSDVPREVVRGLQQAVDPEDECYLLYTSGTTARPKGVVQVHDAVARNGFRIGEYQGLIADDVVWFYYPMFFSAGCINVMLGTLSHGASLILQPSFVPAEAIELIEREQATTWHLWPHTLKELTTHPDWGRRDHSRLHKGTGPYDVMMGGPPEDGLGGVNMYGMTETCTAFTCTHASEALPDRITTNGRLMPDNELIVVDPESGERLPDGEEGELCVKGPAVLRHYYKIDPSETFDEAGFFHTGDLGLLDENGALHFANRKKDMIKTGGINVSPADVESKLVQLDGVAAAYAFPLQSDDKGEVVGAALVVAADREPDVDALLAQCKELLSGYKRPHGLLLLHEDQVPMTGSGKVQKVVMRDRLAAEMQAQGTAVVRWS